MGEALLKRFYVYRCFTCMYVCPVAWTSQKRAWDPPEVELQVGVGNWTWVPGRAASAINHWAISIPKRLVSMFVFRQSSYVGWAGVVCVLGSSSSISEYPDTRQAGRMKQNPSGSEWRGPVSGLADRQVGEKSVSKGHSITAFKCRLSPMIFSETAVCLLEFRDSQTWLQVKNPKVFQKVPVSRQSRPVKSEMLRIRLEHHCFIKTSFCGSNMHQRVSKNGWLSLQWRQFSYHLHGGCPPPTPCWDIPRMLWCDPSGVVMLFRPVGAPGIEWCPSLVPLPTPSCTSDLIFLAELSVENVSHPSPVSPLASWPSFAPNFSSLFFRRQTVPRVPLLLCWPLSRYMFILLEFPILSVVACMQVH